MSIHILFPMLIDALSEADWYEIQKQTPEFGYCLYDPSTEWVPTRPEAVRPAAAQSRDGRIQLPSGSQGLQPWYRLLGHPPR